MDDHGAFLAEPPATEQVTAAYAQDVAADGYVNNATRMWCWRPDVLEAFAALRARLLAETSLSARELAVIVASTAAARGDSYCSLAWGTRLAALSDEATAASVLLGDEPGGDRLSDREAALASWARQVVRDPNATAPADVDGLRRLGITDREIFEATALVGFRLAFSTVNDALGAPPDLQLATAAPQPVRDAVTFGRLPAAPVPYPGAAPGGAAPA